MSTLQKDITLYSWKNWHMSEDVNKVLCALETLFWWLRLELKFVPGRIHCVKIGSSNDLEASVLEKKQRHRL